jgi:hypothetical protein
MEWISYALGTITIFAAGIDVYLTILYARSGTGLISPKLNIFIWALFRQTARLFKRRKHTILSFCGPTIIVVLLAFWVFLFVLGFALITWPQLGNQVVSTNGQTPTNFWSAFYYSCYSFSTLGTGDIVPKSDFYRVLMVIQSVIGFSFFTLIITYFLSLFDAVHRRNVFSLSLHGKTLGTADPTEFVCRIAGDKELIIAQQQFSEISLELTEMLESHHFYPILLYFRFPKIRYGIPRILMITMDTISIFKSTLDEKRYFRQINSVSANELWGSGISLLSHFGKVILPKSTDDGLPVDHEMHQIKWKNHYFVALEKLQQYGVETRKNPEEGVREYIHYRRQWEPYVIGFCRFMLYDEDDLFSFQNE